MSTIENNTKEKKEKSIFDEAPRPNPLENVLPGNKTSSDSTNLKVEHTTMGILGAVIGSLFGVVLWIGLSRNTAILSGILGFVIAMGALGGYEIMGHRLSRKGIIIGLLVAIIMVFAAQSIDFSWKLQAADGTSPVTPGSLFAYFLKIPANLAKDTAFRNSYAKNLFIGYVFTLLSGYYTIHSMHKTATNKAAQTKETKSPKN